jgi:hypothetical protein
MGGAPGLFLATFILWEADMMKPTIPQQKMETQPLTPISTNNQIGFLEGVF